MKYSLSPREIPRAKHEGFPEGTGYNSLYIPIRVTIQTFSIKTPALNFLDINVGRAESRHYSDSFATRESIAHLKYWRVKFQY